MSKGGTSVEKPAETQTKPSVMVTLQILGFKFSKPVQVRLLRKATGYRETAGNKKHVKSTLG